ncbi:phosphohydrolase [Bifidobacterium sp. DSM 109958]|uniref:Phosphohydrolase n=1 Tax=Bifidobacterium moraviense TaxID=2675323 RepID=A0A7Y0F2X3_9BIFI|nr:NUDIX hydrolase [Bifidobacterium sp. DSM 109958]NMN01023.1 phosphohydrolase [Bifidobacterium sp. DSM 109958]
MITPADLARMMSRANNAAGNRTQNPLAARARTHQEPDRLLYSSSSPSLAHGTRDGGAGASGDDGRGEDADDAAARADDGASFVQRIGDHFALPDVLVDVVRGEDEVEDGDANASSAQGFVAPGFPTPAMMPPRRSQDTPSTFASLDAQELPVVREYSAGGLIFDERGRVAIIARHSRSGHLEWCLPKGHIEKGETPEQTAVREVHEETGILGEVIESIATIDYWFTGTSQRVHKLVHHYALRRVSGDLTVDGDPDHEAEDAIWVNFADLDDVLSYPNERKIAWLYARKTKKRT